MRLLLLVGLAGCSSIFGLKSPQPASDASTGGGDGGDGGGGGGDATDAAVDSSTDGVMADAQQCFGSGNYTVCLDALPSMPKSLSGTINTSNAAACSSTAHWTSAAQPAACFIVGTDVTVGPLVATGGLPLVIVGTNQVTFNGLVDVSSHEGSLAFGAGFIPVGGGCNMASPAQTNNAGGGGGAGGSFATVGGNGGGGYNNTMGGTPGAALAIDTLRGGCAGETGARGGGGNLPVPGAGGGALYVVAGNSIVLGTATLAANGAGGGAPSNRIGGSGGGTGGMLVLRAPSISANGATLIANGGGGSSGTDGGTGVAGHDPAAPTAPALGGNAGLNSAQGGAGFATGSPAGDGGAGFGVNESGAGGGGGAGYIRSNAAISGITASPSVDIVP